MFIMVLMHQESILTLVVGVLCMHALQTVSRTYGISYLHPQSESSLPQGLCLEAKT